MLLILHFHSALTSVFTHLAEVSHSIHIIASNYLDCSGTHCCVCLGKSNVFFAAEENLAVELLNKYLLSKLLTNYIYLMKCLYVFIFINIYCDLKH